MTASGVVVVSRIRTSSGKVIYVRPTEPAVQAIDPRNVAMMNTMMQETLLSGTARKAEIPGWPAAGKTGTSQDFRDAWFVGYTSRLVAAVWLGNDDNTPTRKVTGGNLPVEIWSRFMRAAHQNAAPTALPGGRYRLAPVDGAPSDASPVALLNMPPAPRGRVPPPPPSDAERLIPAERGFLERLFSGG